MRNYIVASWSDADQYDYSGEQLGGSRHAGRSQRVHFNPDGSACVASYADDEPNKKKSSISIADRILPQQRRLQTLTEQMRELVADYKSGAYTIEEYTLLLNVLTVKRDRCAELLMKARSVKPKSVEELYTPKSTPKQAYSSEYTSSVQPPHYTSNPVVNKVMYGVYALIGIALVVCLSHL